MTSAFETFCVCPRCRADLAADGDRYRCASCEATYAVDDGVLDLRVEPEGDERRRYVESYERLATADLEQPLEATRDARHSSLVDFIGNVRGKRVLDVGSSYGAYLAELDAQFSVALDLALPFLKAIRSDRVDARVCADAEGLPVRPGFFDVIILADILEHVLDPERVVQHVLAVCTPRTRVIVHVPWEEDISVYAHSDFEFTHLRTFDAQAVALLFRHFYLARERGTYPSLEQPAVFRMRRALPRPLYNLLVYRYFYGGQAREYRRRERWINELPKRERRLLYVYRPKFRMFEFRTIEGSWLEKLGRLALLRAS